MGGPVSGMHIDLAEINYAIIFKEQSDLYSRINLVALLVADVSAMIRDAHNRSHEKPSKEDLATIEECWDTVQEMRKKYDPMLDTDEFTYSDRAPFDIVLDDVVRDMKRIMYDYDLLKAGAIPTQQGGKFGSEKQQEQGEQGENSW